MSRRLKFGFVALIFLVVVGTVLRSIQLWHVQNPLRLRVVDIRPHPQGGKAVYYEVHNASSGPVNILDLKLHHTPIPVPGQLPRIRYATDEVVVYPLTLRGGKTYSGCIWAHEEALLRNDEKCYFTGEWEPTLQTQYKHAYGWIYDHLDGRIPPSWWEPYVPSYPSKGRYFYSTPLNLPAEGPLLKEWHATESPKVPIRPPKK